MSHACQLSYNKEFITSKKAVALIGATFFILATALGSYVRIPVPGSPVPITLQTFFVLLAGAILGRRLGTASQAGYMLLGAMGLPVFQGTSIGAAYLLGPTGGYIAGFVAAAYITGFLLRSDRPGMARIISSFAIGSFVIYLFGALWLIIMYRMSLTNAVSAGVLPFIPGDMAKVLLASVVYSGISQRSKQIFSS